MKVNPSLLVAARSRSRLLSKDLAELANIDVATLWRLENGKSPGSPAVIGRLADALGVDVTEITNPLPGGAES